MDREKFVSKDIPFWPEEHVSVFDLRTGEFFVLGESKHFLERNEIAFAQCWWNSNLYEALEFPHIIPAFKDDDVASVVERFKDRLLQRYAGEDMPHLPEVKLVSGMLFISKEHNIPVYVVAKRPDGQFVLISFAANSKEQILTDETIPRNSSYRYWDGKEYV